MSVFLLLPLIALVLAGCAGRPEGPPALQSGEVPTWNRHIARLAQRHCQECHRPEGGAPFSLVTYEDAARQLKKIGKVVTDHRMPPWAPVAGFGEFRDARGLSAEEIRLIQRWLEAGAPEGDPREAPKPLVFSDTWKLGRPAVVVQPAEAFTVPARSQDIYRCIPIPLTAAGGRFLSAVEILPGNRKIVHHVVTFLDLTGRSVELARAASGNGYTCFGGPGFQSAGGMGGWAPGLGPLVLPPRVAWRLPTGAHVVMQVHYHNPGDRDETDRTQIGLHFTEPPFDRRLAYIPVRTRAIWIPAGERAAEATVEREVDSNLAMDASSIQGHMHLLGRGLRVTVHYPDGSSRPLLRVDDWSFERQERYQYREQVPLPAGAVIKLTCVYDNSEANRNNPNTPPRNVSFGFQTTDEMCEAHILGTASLR